jgi:hypothetical protein
MRLLGHWYALSEARFNIPNDIAKHQTEAHLKGVPPAGAKRHTAQCPLEYHNMSAPTESEDPDYLVHAAWLAQVSKGADRAAAEQIPKEARGSLSTSSLEPANHLVRQQVRLAPPSPGVSRSALIGCICVMVLFALIAIPLALFERWRQPTIELSSSESRTVMQNEVGTPKLIVEPSLGIAGEPVPIGLSLREQVNDAIVIISGLVPGMELSAGSAVAGDTWQLPASDLPYAWVAPPRDFVGSAPLVAELRLPNAQIADRQALRLEWMQPAPTGYTLGQRSETAPPSAPTTAQHPNDRVVVTAPRPISIEPSQDKIDREYGENARARSRNNLRRATHDILDVADRKPKGFWDWSR